MDTDTAWRLWGERDPYYSVLTDPKYRSSAITDAAKEEFFLHGRDQVQHVIQTCQRQFGESFLPSRILDFGCGVGRLLIPFAASAQQVVGMDIAPAMLEEARRNCATAGVANVLLVPSDDLLSKADGVFDLVHSSIVLQHLEIARGRSLFQLLVEKIAPGGCGALHVTFGWTHHAQTYGQVPPPPPPPQSTARGRLRALIRAMLPKPAAQPAPPPEANADPEMQMNYYNLSELHFILMTAGVRRVYSELTDHGGALGAMLYVQRPN